MGGGGDGGSPDPKRGSVKLPILTAASNILIWCRGWGTLTHGVLEDNPGPCGAEKVREEEVSRKVSYFQLVKNPNGNYRLTEYSCVQPEKFNLSQLRRKKMELIGL